MPDPSKFLKPLDPRVLIDVHYRIGLAMWHSQAFEDSLCFFIALALKLPPSRAESELRAIPEDLQSLTLGRLLAELRKPKSSTAVDSFEHRLNKFLSERNWLVHHSWREHHADLFNPSRLPPLVSRLEKLAQEGSDLQNVFGRILHDWMLARGFKDEPRTFGESVER